ncbi:microtubule-associated protein futsch-like isoform X2 [Tigriopus californicus]|uniref:microtubule-associated protein futsch-like isoform X2 n=1 Tax=Tigriopus californicus TaxID=6832 RepID=UPI0027DA621B|nr:microtubule-associated protein futsch-like isoform X2 [Tigriopus californicus]
MAPMTDKAPLIGLQEREKSQDEPVKNGSMPSPTTSQPPSRKTSTHEIVSCFRSGGSINVPRKISQGPLQSFIPKGGPTMENVQDEIKARFRRGYSKVKAVNSFKDQVPPVKKALPKTQATSATHQCKETTNAERQTADVINEKPCKAANPITMKQINHTDHMINGPSYVGKTSSHIQISQDHIEPILVTKKTSAHTQHNAQTWPLDMPVSEASNHLPSIENQPDQAESSFPLTSSSSRPLRSLPQTNLNHPNLNLSSITVVQNLPLEEMGDSHKASEVVEMESVRVPVDPRVEEKVQKPELNADKESELDDEDEIKPVKDIIVKRKPKLQKIETVDSINELTPSPLVAQYNEDDENGDSYGMQVQNPGTAKIDRSHRLSTANSFDSNHCKQSEDLSDLININKDEGLEQTKGNSIPSTKVESSHMIEEEKVDKIGKTAREDNGKRKSPSPMTAIWEPSNLAESQGILPGIAEHPHANQRSNDTAQADWPTDQSPVVSQPSAGNEPSRPTTSLEGVSRRRKFSEEFKSRAQDREKRVSRLEEIRQMERELEPKKRSEDGMDEGNVPPEAEVRSCSKHSRCHCYLFSIPNAFRMYGLIS